MRPARLAIGAVVAVAALAGSWFVYDRFVLGRATAAACGEQAAFGKRSRPEVGFAVLEEHGQTILESKVIFASDGRVIDDGETLRFSPETVRDLQRSLEATGVYGLRSGCYAKAMAIASDHADAHHLWLVKDGVAYEYAWLGSPAAPRELDDAWRLLRDARKKAHAGSVAP